LGGQAFRQHIILLLAARNFSDEMFNYLCKCIETYLFYCLFIKEQAKIYETVFAKWDLTLSSINTMEGLEVWVKENIAPEIEKRKNEYEGRFLSFGQNDLQQYRVRYILAKLEQYVDNSKLGVYTLTTLDEYMNLVLK